MKVEIFLPGGYEKEREYIISVLFSDFLEVPHVIHTENRKDYKITFNNKTLIIEDHFFSTLKPEKGYLSVDVIPRTPTFFSCERLPIIYGRDKLQVRPDEICCGLDLFGSSFFMLSRFEEYISGEQDKHGRFPATESVAYKWGFLNRPIVNEYAEFLLTLMMQLGLPKQEKTGSFTPLITHDVDYILKWKRPCARRFLSGIRKKKNPLQVFSNLSEYIKTQSGKIKDPYDMFDNIMDLSERYNLTSHFYFMAENKGSLDGNYLPKEPFCRELLKVIDQRGHEIGFHPSYHSLDNQDRWLKEKFALQEVSPKKIVGGRQHFLRFSAPYTWQLWEDCQMEYDSTLGYAEKEGFRAGTCTPFHPFNFLTKKKLQLLERPLTVMEGSFFTYQDLSDDEILHRVTQLIEIVKKHRGEFVFLWHNSTFDIYNKSQEFYEQFLTILNKALSTTD